MIVFYLYVNIVILCFSFMNNKFTKLNFKKWVGYNQSQDLYPRTKI